MKNLIKLTDNVIETFEEEKQLIVDYSEAPGHYYDFWVNEGNSDDLGMVKITKCFGYKSDDDTIISETLALAFPDLSSAVDYVNTSGDSWLHDVETCEIRRNENGFPYQVINRQTVGHHTRTIKTYKIPVYYTMYGYVEIEADCLEQAMDTAMYGDIGIEDVKEPEYMADSWYTGDDKECKEFNGIDY